MLTVKPITTPGKLQTAFAIRRKVFVEEQHVSANDEYDEFESESRHFLAHVSGQPAGTARWRKTPTGYKLERFAVLPDFRGQGVGKALVEAVLTDVLATHPPADSLVYMHAQLTAMPLYAGFGFVAVGPMFEECGIRHYKMVCPVSSFVG